MHYSIEFAYLPNKSIAMQPESKLYIKGMVCQRCVATVDEQLKALGIHPIRIKLGEVVVKELNSISRSTINQALQSHGFSLLEDRNEKIVSEVKQLVSKTYGGDFDFPYQFRFSNLVIKYFNKDYDTISSIFSSFEHITLEKYIIDFRINKVKEFLVYTPLSLENIAFKLGFSSAPHLSRQFKSITGTNPSHFRNIREAKERLADSNVL